MGCYSWAALGRSLAGLGRSGIALGRSWGALGRSRGRSWAALGRRWGALSVPWGPQSRQDRPQRSQEWPETARRGPKNEPRPPTEAQEVMGRSPTLSVLRPLREIRGRIPEDVLGRSWSDLGRRFTALRFEDTKQNIAMCCNVLVVWVDLGVVLGRPKGTQKASQATPKQHQVEDKFQESEQYSLQDRLGAVLGGF